MLCSGRKLNCLRQLCGKHVSNELGYLAEEISKPSAESVAWFLAAGTKMQEETNKLREELLKLN